MQTVPETMRANVLTAARSLELQERPVPTPAPDEVLIKVMAVGVCGSDVHFYEDARLGEWVINEPLVLGHEAAGQIVAVGAAVPIHRVGERVSIEPQHPSPTSPESMRGEYNLDPDMRFYAVPGVDGAFQEYVTIQSHFAYHVPDSVSDDAAALMEPLSVAIATARKAAIAPGTRIYITGAGPIGLITAQVARAFGATDVIVADVNGERREVASRFGATRALDPTTDQVDELGADAFIDASGAEVAIQGGVAAVRPGGHVVLVGMGASEMTLPVSTIMSRELRLTGVFRYANTWPTAVAFVADRTVDLDGLVTGHYALDQVSAALESTRQPGTHGHLFLTFA